MKKNSFKYYEVITGKKGDFKTYKKHKLPVTKDYKKEFKNILMVKLTN